LSWFYRNIFLKVNCMLIQTLLIICILLAILISFSKKREPFKTVQTSYSAYGTEHSNVYDSLVYDGLKNEMELSFLQPTLTNSSNVLDIGCGTGHHVHALNERGINAIGLDNSSAMISRAKKQYSHEFFEGNALSTALFPSESFTHILCMYFTLYCMKHKEHFFNNAYYWLTPDGYLAVHLSEKWSYGPTSSFKGPFSYKNDYSRETITIQGKRKRIEHQVYMESISTILGIAKQAGFIVHSIYAYDIPYKGQFLYVFTKP
jgi:ubiquinone/menaquinone biosynthesis C-methylase UbiE